MIQNIDVAVCGRMKHQSGAIGMNGQGYCVDLIWAQYISRSIVSQEYPDGEK